MKYLIYLIILLALGLLVFNATQLNWAHPFGENSAGPWIGILASLCGVVVMLILISSRAIKKKYEKNG